ncbi:5'-nucleotidase domain-containing protein 3 isoform X2 [Bombus flavifrons]|uniref:5'-nucleotidase domain-containing protein 3 isoform X2 n=1 Tax=Bombus flavifrons TaxID=103934 RepID=UPI0037037D98
MLHTRTLAVAAASPLIIESVLPSWLVRVSGSHVVPKRSVGDRALSRGQISRKDMLDNYQKTREKYKSKKLPLDVNPKGVFACNELDLKEVQVYGFDYDYTLACYKPSMDYLLYSLGRDMLIQKYKDALRRTKMIQLADLFSVPEMGLLCNVTEYFLRNHIDYHPEILFRDVKNSVQSCHPIMHGLVVQNVSEYLEQNKDLKRFFDRLKKANKKMFLVTNSPFHFVDTGMRFLVGDNWKDYFDVVIVQARKPKFFTEESRPLRIYDEVNKTQLWDRVTKLQKGVIYLEGTVKQLQDMTGWRGHQVLYFGDHPYSDLADVTLEHGWRTGAIITELTHEIATLNNPKFKENANWLQMLTGLIEEHQDYEGTDVQAVLDEWIKERDKLRNEIKRVFNEQFGSVFRTYHNPTYFSRRLFRFADIYMSSITNLLEYATSHTFYPRRGVMPHEYTSYFV